jgi:hypothetical protein
VSELRRKFEAAVRRAGRGRRTADIDRRLAALADELGPRRSTDRTDITRRLAALYEPERHAGSRRR